MATQDVGARFPKPRGLTLWLMIGMFSIWLVYALALNWGGLDPAAFAILTGDAQGVLLGQLWPFVSAMFLHSPNSVWHIAVTLLLVYFFVPPLLDRWGARKLMVFLIGSGAFAFAVETLLYFIFPTVAHRNWFGGMVMADAACVAWAVGARGQTVRFYFVIPMKPMVMVLIMVIFHVLSLIARTGGSPEGVFAPFAAIGAGFLFTDGSPLRRLYLKLKLRRLQSEVEGLTRARKNRVRGASHLRVIDGGDDDDDDEMLH